MAPAPHPHCRRAPRSAAAELEDSTMQCFVPAFFSSFLSLLTASLLLASPVARAQTQEQFTRNAQAFAARAAFPMVAVQETSPGQWVQIQARATGAKWAIKPAAANSTALVATVTVDVYWVVSETKPTRDEAADQGDLVANRVERLELEYLPVSGGWAFARGRSTARGQTTELQASPPSAGFVPSAWAAQGFVVKP